ncbi:restriction endonuclease subunit S [Mangrovimonas sp. YM274]|uniref:restriction endonuclease subunit S n=1 Tax=Mangrovimonas sp. YM274 TaxID=3070660 RepID=UPI0027DE5E21|nr:restriction endonuclease subunit S [Mangrovimonas sp. YM274]WMI70262.1 restriction endonuclease subunit S [Mangrovimonas sp. YM274]
MKSKYKTLGQFIEPCNEKNLKREISDSMLRGISNQKYFQKAKTNTIGVDLSKYRIVRKGQFAFNRATTRNGDKISIALRKGKDCIVSPSYRIFRSKDENILNSEYLMMWFRRPEFDRYARFKSHGSAHEFFDYDEMCEVELPVPSIEKQREIVAEYNTVINRIKLNKQFNQKLEETAQALYKHWFVDFEFPNEEGKPYKSSGGEMVYNEELDKEIPEGWEAASISDFGKVITGKTPSSKNPEDFGDEMLFITPGDFKFYNKFALSSVRKLSKSGINRLSNKVLPKGSIIVTCIGSDMGKIVVTNYNCITNQQMNSIIGYEKCYTDYLFHHLTFIADEIKAIAMGSSTMPMLNKSDFEKVLLLRPKLELLKVFDRLLEPINDELINLSTQTKNLKLLQNLLLSKMTKL